MKNTRTSVLQERLSKAAAYLEHLDEERAERGDSTLGKPIEKRIIWRELLELELQDAEERITSMCDAAERALALLE